MLLQKSLGEQLLEAESLREVYELLHGYPLMGDFMSYQTAIDLNLLRSYQFYRKRVHPGRSGRTQTRSTSQTTAG
ncbi:MAG: nucleotide kinase domain-containing protein [Egibacteraceae bacterium]